MKSNREAVISKLSVGDIFRASFPNGAKRICVVTSVIKTTMAARAITTQEDFDFDRSFGTAESIEGAVCTIDSVHPLSEEIRSALLELDLRYRREAGSAGLPLSISERRALLEAGALFSSNPLPP